MASARSIASRSRGGEAERLTNADESVNSFAWSPDGKSIAFTMIDPMSEAMKEREKRWGDIRIEDQDQRYTHLYVFDVAARTVKQVTKGNFVVGSFDWSPDSRTIAYDHRATSDPADGGTADISIVTSRHARNPRRRRAGRARRESSLVARRLADRVRDVDGQAELLLCEQRHRGHRAGIGVGAQPDRQFRRRSQSGCVDQGRHSLLGVATYLGVPLHDQSRHQTDHQACRAR